SPGEHVVMLAQWSGVLRPGGAQSRHIQRRVQLEISLASYATEIIRLTCITGLTGGFGFIDTHPADGIYRELRLAVGIIDEPKCFLHRRFSLVPFSRPVSRPGCALPHFELRRERRQLVVDRRLLLFG